MRSLLVLSFVSCLAFSLAACSSPKAPTSARGATTGISAQVDATAANDTARGASQASETQEPEAEATVVSVTESTAEPQPGTEALLFQPFREDFQTAPGQLSPYLQQWAEALAQERNIPLPLIEGLLNQVRYDPQVIRLMTPAQGRAAKKSWSAYRERFVEQVRLQAGLKFWRSNEAEIAKVAEQYQIPASVLVAIIGVETIFGQYIGDFKVLNTLANLGFSYPDARRPERAAMFRAQLADFIELHHQEKLDANSARGSFAGAMGLPQFMPTSIKKWAIDAEDKGYVDLYGSIPDTLASVANFLNHHGWQHDLPVFLTLPHQQPSLAQWVDGGLTPTLSWSDLQEAQITPDIDPQKGKEQQFALIDLVDEVQGQTEFRLATANFFALTAYNRSYFYASAVADFACALEQAFYRSTATCQLWRYPQ